MKHCMLTFGAGFSLLLILVSLTRCSSSATDERILVAVASNFLPTMNQLVAQFERKTSSKVVIVAASSGKHYTQIINGFQVDLFLSADTLRPALLEKGGQAVRGTRFTYSRGRLILWSPASGQVDSRGEVLQTGRFTHLAIANPDLAPYGAAAKEVLQSIGEWENRQQQLVRGENVNQAMQFVISGNAELGFIAYSQYLDLDPEMRGSWWEVPASLYTPIEQQAVLLREGSPARSLWLFLQGAEARQIIETAGYLPGKTSG